MLKITSWYGRLGNNITQLKNVLYIALYCNYNIEIPRHMFFKATKIIINKSYENHNNIIDNEGIEFYYQNKLEKYKICFTKNHEKVKKILQDIFKIDIRNIEKKEGLIIHIRSGDQLITTNPNPKYIMAPLSYYKKIIEENKNKKIQIVCEDTINPCVNELLKIYPEISYNRRTLIEDIKIILGAENIVSTIGTFIPGLCWMSNNIKKVYIASYDFTLKDSVYPKNVEKEIIIMEDYKNKMVKWENSKEQKQIMLEYEFK